MNIFRRMHLSPSHSNVVLVVLFLNVVIVALFWSVLGNNYTVVNDGWVSVSMLDRMESDPDSGVQLKLDPRVVRSAPFILASKLDDVGFTALNTILILVNVFTGLGIFVVLSKIFPDKTLLSAVSSVLIMYFPSDGTMFWLGAFGVNLGYLLSIYALYFFICSVEDSSRTTFWVALLLMFASIWTYPGYLPVQALVLSLYLFMIKKSWRGWWRKAFLFLLIWMIGFVKFADNAISGRGREGNVADFALNEVLNGFSHAIRHLFVDAWSTLFDLSFAHWARGLVITLAALVAFYLIYRLVTEPKATDKDCSASYKKIDLWLVVVALLIVVAGYAPYAASDIRYGTDRQLLFARPGVVLLYMTTLFWLVFSLIRSRRIANMTIIILSATILGLSVQSKAKLAEEYAAASRMERIFLGDLADCIPSIKGNPSVLLYFDDNDIVVNKKAAMLLNRPSYPVRYLYKRTDLDVTTTNPFYMKKFGAEIEGEFLIVRNSKMLINNTIVLSYSLSQGFKVL